MVESGHCVGRTYTKKEPCTFDLKKEKKAFDPKSIVFPMFNKWKRDILSWGCS